MPAPTPPETLPRPASPLPGPETNRRWGVWLTYSLWAALVLAAGRAAVLFGMEHFAHGGGVDRAAMRIADVLPAELLVASVAALAVGCAVAILERMSVRRGTRRALLAILIVAAAGLFLVTLAGWGRGDLSRAVGLETPRGQKAVRLVGAAAALLALGQVAWIHIGLRRPRRPRLRAVALPLVLGLAAASIVRILYGDVGSWMELQHVTRNLALDASWEILAQHPREAPHAGILSPATQYQLNGADMYGLLLPPPARVAFTVWPEDGRVRLEARAGIDRDVLLHHGTELEGHSVSFTVEVNGEERFATAIPVEEVDGLPGMEWVPVGGEEGLELAVGDRVELATRLLGPEGTEVQPRLAVAAGFGGLTLERRSRRARTRSSPSQPNIVLVLMDTQRADRLSAYGYERPTSPHLERLAERGLLFREAFSTASWTWPSTASVLTGLQPEEHGVQDPTSCFLADDLDTLAEVLQREGFTTAAWSANALIVPDKNFDQGFEFFDYGKGTKRPSEIFMPAALDWIEEVAGTRFFLYLHLLDPHAPLRPLPEGRELLAAEVPEDFPANMISHVHGNLLHNEGHDESGRILTEACVSSEDQQHMRDLYDACVWSGDYWVGQVLETLERLGLDDETIVVFTADHGEELFDHGLATHGHSLHRELVHVPLVMAGPGIPHGVRDGLVSNSQIAPTLARVAGTVLPALQDPVDLLGENPAQAEVTFSTRHGWWNGRHPQPLLGIRRGTDVFHLAPLGSPWGVEEPEPGGEWRLYDARTDPGEQRDLAKARDVEARRLRDMLLELVESLQQRHTTPTVPAGAATLEFLRQIGYIGDE